MFLKGLRVVLRLLFNLFTQTKVTGLENVPLSGGCILAMNHLGRLDPAIIYCFVERDDLTALVAKKYQKFFLTRWIVNFVGGIWLDRNEADIQALRNARAFLKAGGCLGIAPEGTRSPTQALIRGKPGVAFLASKVSAPIIPVAMTGTERAFQDLLRLRRPRLTLRFGEPFNLPPLIPRDRDGSLQRNTDLIMDKIARLLPATYRGVYGNPTNLAQ